MSIRIGGSAAFSLAMITPESRVEETRRYLLNPTQWYEISAKCIAEKKFLILTICIGFSDKLEYMPDENQWRSIIEDSTVKLLSVGGNRHNCRIDIINEPEKYCTKEKQAWLINIAHSQINGRLIMGAGCSELNQQERYQYISSHSTFEVLVIHIQGACDTEVKTSYYTNIAKNLAVSYKRGIDCNEANYSNVATSKGFERLKMQIRYAEKIGCPDICIAFLDLDQSAFSVNTDKWTFLSFKVNGKLRSPYWNDFVNIINSRAPIPNIKIPIIISEDDMKLKVLKVGSKGNQVLWLQEILAYSYGIDNEGGFDGIYGTKTFDQVKTYQANNGLTQDGLVGKNTMFKLIEKSITPEKWFMRLRVYMAYE